MKSLVVESWLLLARFEWIMRFAGFDELYRTVREEQMGRSSTDQLTPKEDLCRAMDYACVLYFKQVLCLQRSAATTLLLRHHGWNVDLVIGAQILPFKSHAWCEIDGVVFNDKPYIRDIYQVLERC